MDDYIIVGGFHSTNESVHTLSRETCKLALVCAGNSRPDYTREFRVDVYIHLSVGLGGWQFVQVHMYVIDR